MDSSTQQQSNSPSQSQSQSQSEAEAQDQAIQQARSLAAHEPSSTPSLPSLSSSMSSIASNPGGGGESLPPEAIALAGRFFDAARKGDEQSEVLLRAALQRGGEGLANLTNDKGDSLIMLSSYHGHLPLVNLLLSHGANPNRLNDKGQSPLAGVVFKNERECVLALLRGGADPELGTPNAVECCRVFGQTEYLRLFEEQVERLKG